MIALVLPLQLLPNTKLVWVYDLGVVAIYFPILLYLAAQSRSGAAWTWIAGALGAASYPLYILHVPIWNTLQLWFDAPMRLAAPWSGIGLVAGLILLGWSFETFLDLPLRRMAARRLMIRPVTGATSAASVAQS
jgi:peptidoglycan/LPS O-acetylase OafA/YrhL